MGLYDTFYYTCPNCCEEACSQTKLGNCTLDVLTIGCSFNVNGKILMKDECEHCEKYNIVIIDNETIVGFAKKDQAETKEVCWGNVEQIDI